MGLTAEIAKENGIAVKHSGSLELIAAEDVDKFIEAVRNVSYNVLGIEGFFLVADKLYPDMDAIADYSTLQDQSQLYDTFTSAKNFINQASKPGMYFDFVLSGGSGPKSVGYH